MSDFEQKYYESDAFWDGTVEDEANKQRFLMTAKTVPEECKSLLDAGCGNGVFGRYLSRHNSHLTRVVNMDRSFSALSRVEGESVQGSIDSIPFDSKTFDCVTCLEVIEHLPIPLFEKALAELCRVSSKYLIVSVPFRERVSENMTTCPGCQSSFNIDLHLRTFDEARMKSLVVGNGFQNVSVQTLVESEMFIGWETFCNVRRWLKSKLRPSGFRSPICPLCGYENKDFDRTQVAGAVADVSRVSLWNRVQKLTYRICNAVLPKRRHPGYWVIGLYRRIDG